MTETQPGVRHEGFIVRVSASGLAYIQDSASHLVYASTFDKIHGYRGETARELGLSAGTPVIFFVDPATDKVSEIEIETEVAANAAR